MNRLPSRDIFFFSLHPDPPAVMFSPGGLLSKIAQILLEVALIYVTTVSWRRPSN